MSDRGYAFLVTAAKYFFINLITFILIVQCMRWGWITDEDTIVVLHTIVNAAAVILGKLQQILDRLNEIASPKK